MATHVRDAPGLRCAFCFRHQDEVADIVRGPDDNTTICDNCIDLAHGIVTRARERRAAEGMVPA